MPQSTKDSQGGKTHPGKDTGSNATGSKSGEGQKAAERKPGSPVDTPKHGEKKTSP